MISYFRGRRILRGFDSRVADSPPREAPWISAPATQEQPEDGGHDQYAEEEAQVVQAPFVVHFIHLHVLLGDEGRHQGHRGDDPCHSPSQKPAGRPWLSGVLTSGFGPGA